MRSSTNSPIYYASLLLALLGVLSSYFIIDIQQGIGLWGAQYTGTITILQFAWLSLCMLSAWKYAPPLHSISDCQHLLGIALIAHLILIPIDSYTSNDITRYLFDGKIALEGLDPYSINHNNNQLTQLKNQWAPPPEHAKYTTLYPPLALGLFSLSASAGITYASVVWKILVAFASIGSLCASALILQHIQRLAYLPLIALSPLLILETGVGAHVDAFSTLFVCLCIWAWQRNKLLLSGVFIALGTLVKLLPLALLLPLFFSARSRKDAFTLCASTISVIISAYALMFLLGFRPIGSISIFFQKWRFGSPAFQTLDSLLSSNTLIIVILTTLASVSALIAWRCFQIGRRSPSTNQQNTIYASIQYMLALPLLLSPVIFPWYLMPLVPLLSMYTRPWLLLWILLAPLSYEVLGQFACCNNWAPAQWPLFILAAGLGIGLFLHTKFNDKKSSQAPAL